MGLQADIIAAASVGYYEVIGVRELDGDVTNGVTIYMKHGSIITFVGTGTTRTLGNAVDFSDGGQIQVGRGKTFTLTGRLTLPPNVHAFDVSFSGVDLSTGGAFHISPQSVDRLTPYNFGAKGDDGAGADASGDPSIGSVNTGTDELTITAHPFSTGDQVQLTTTGTLPSPLQTGTSYWAIKTGASTIQLAASSTNALAGTAINITASGTGNVTRVYDDTPLRAWIAACEYNVGVLASSGGIIPYVPPGEFKFGRNLDTDSRGDHVALQWRKHLLKVEGAGARNSRFHFAPLIADDGKYFFAMRWESSRISIAAQTVSSVNTTTDQLTTTASHGLSTGNQVQLTTTGTLPSPLATATTYWVIMVDSTNIKLATSRANALAGTAIDLTATGTPTHTVSGASNPEVVQLAGVRGISISTTVSENTGYLKCAFDLHDCRDFRLHDVDITHWTKLSDPRCIGIRLRGRDAYEINGLKTTSCDLPIVIDHNDEEIEPLTNGLPTVWRDDKDVDHITITNGDLGVTDNRYKAAIWIKPGVVVRNLTVGPYVALVGGGIVCVDRLDTGPNDVLSVDTAVETLTLTTAHLMSTGDQVQISGSNLPAGLLGGTWYWVIKVDATTIKLASSSANALAGTAINLTTTGSGTRTISAVAFASATTVEPRRTSNHWRFVDGRTEGFSNATPTTFAVRIERHQNGRLRELALDNHLLGEGSDARRAVATGAGTYVTPDWHGLRAKGVERVALTGSVRYGANGTPLDVDTDCKLDSSPVVELVASDNNRRLPEIEAQWDYLAVSRLRSWWLMQQPTQDNPIADQQKSQLVNYPLDPTGSTTPRYAKLIDGWRGAWIEFTGIANQKLRLNQNTSELAPASHSVAATGIWRFTSAPPGDRDLCNLAGDTNGPMLRLNSSGQLFIRANGVTGTASSLTFTDGQPLIFWFAHNRNLKTLTCWLAKFDGSRELITGTYFDSPGNDVNKGFGPFSGAATSPAGWIRFGGWALDTVAEQIGYDVFRALNWLQFTKYSTYLSALGATGTSANNGYATIPSGGGPNYMPCPVKLGDRIRFFEPVYNRTASTTTVYLRRIASDGSVTTLATFTDTTLTGWRKGSSAVFDHAVVAGSTYYFVMEAGANPWSLAGIQLHCEQP